ncbi:MAG TPA: M3 family oligoendopeptidase, partial [Fibrobacteraceae bacterium]|nr:M3 family oligoendopeptidase [Fibrobacteraceae bacterium]
MNTILPERHFVPRDFLCDHPERVSSLYAQLQERSIPETSDALRQWILDWSEFESLLREEGARRYIAMTKDTRDTVAAQAFEYFTTQIEPVAAEASDRLKRKLVSHPSYSSLRNEYATWFRDVEVSLELFRPENIPLETRVALEVQSYQKITGSMSVQFQGEERTLPQMAPFQQSPNRKLREEAWRLVAERRLRDHEALDEAFDRLFALRQEMAGNAGFKADFLSYIFKAKGRFDYSPADCRAFHQSIRDQVVPRIRKIMVRRAKTMGLPSLRPWDLDCDPLGREALKPFSTGAELLQKTGVVFDRLHPQLAQWFHQMCDQGLIDADSRMGKAPGGYQISLDASRVPFIFTNAAGTNGDVYTLLHESGHSFHQFAMAGQPILAFRETGAEFAEVASMSMELIGSSDLTPFYASAEAARSRAEQLEDVILLFPWVAMVDAFQHRLYMFPQHKAEDRRRIWLELQEEFDYGVDWTGLEQEHAYYWQRQLHLFEVPFYY